MKKAQSLAYILVTISILSLAAFGMGYIAIRASSESALPFYRTQIVQTAQTAENIKFLLDRERRYTFEKIIYQIGSRGGYGGNQSQIRDQECGYLDTLPKHNYMPEKIVPYWYNASSNPTFCIPEFTSILNNITLIAERFSATPDQNFLNSLEIVYGLDFNVKYVYQLASCGVKNSDIGGDLCPSSDRNYFENQWFIVGDDKIRLLGASYQGKPSVSYTATTLVHNVVENKFPSLYEEAKNFVLNKDYETMAKQQLNKYSIITHNETCAYSIDQTGTYSADTSYGEEVNPDSTITGFDEDRQCTGSYSSGMNDVHVLKQRFAFNTENYNETSRDCGGDNCKTTMVSMCVDGEWTGCVPGIKKSVGEFVWYETPNPEFSTQNPTCKIKSREPMRTGTCSGEEPVNCSATCFYDASRVEKMILDEFNSERGLAASHDGYNYTFTDNEASIDYVDTGGDEGPYTYAMETYNTSCVPCDPRDMLDDWSLIKIDSDGTIDWDNTDRQRVRDFYDDVWNDGNNDLEEAPPYSDKKVQTLTRFDDEFENQLFKAYGALSGKIKGYYSFNDQLIQASACQSVGAYFDLSEHFARQQAIRWFIRNYDTNNNQIGGTEQPSSYNDKIRLGLTFPEGSNYARTDVTACVTANYVSGSPPSTTQNVDNPQTRHTNCTTMSITLDAKPVPTAVISPIGKILYPGGWWCGGITWVDSVNYWLNAQGSSQKINLDSQCGIPETDCDYHWQVKNRDGDIIYPSPSSPTENPRDLITFVEHDTDCTQGYPESSINVKLTVICTHSSGFTTSAVTQTTFGYNNINVCEQTGYCCANCAAGTFISLFNPATQNCCSGTDILGNEYFVVRGSCWGLEVNRCG